MAKTKSKRDQTLGLQKLEGLMNTEFVNLFGIQSEFYKTFVQIFPQNIDISKWMDLFSKIYHDDKLDYELYVKHNYLALICSLSRDIFNNIVEIVCIKSGCIQIKQLDEIIAKFYPFISNTNKNNNNDYNTFQSLLFNDLTNYFKIATNNPVNNVTIDLYNLLYQELIIPDRRHKLGEFYTPIPLVKLMVKETYKIGDSVLDPACGTGTFLVQIIEMIADSNIEFNELKQYVLKIYGIEINPLTAIVARLNMIQYLLLRYFRSLTKENITEFAEMLTLASNNILITDFIMEESFFDPDITKIMVNFLKKQKTSLIIGNPPWLVINGINSIPYKSELKELARRFEIGTSTQNISNIELSSIFLVKSVKEYLSDAGRIFFITSAGIITGSQNDRVRRFNGLKNITIWKFDKDLFNIHNICLYGEKAETDADPKFEVVVETKKCIEQPISITSGKRETYVPAYVKKEGDNNRDFLVGRLIPQSESQNGVKNNNRGIDGINITSGAHSSIDGLIQESSIYKERFRQGACLVPQNLLYCTPILDKSHLEKDSNSILIEPDLSIQYKKYGDWDFKAFDSAVVETEFIHFSAKSTDLVPFFLPYTNILFIPVNIFCNHNLSEWYNNQKKLNKPFKPDLSRFEYAQNHYAKLNQVYHDHIKSGSSIPDLLQNINHNNKLFNINQRTRLKLVYNGIGSIVKAAIVRGDIIIDSSLYYMVPESEDEAYYLMGVLNAPVITMETKKRGSTGSNGSLRNIHKYPLESNIPKYTGSESQRLIISISKKMESYVLDFIMNYLKDQFFQAKIKFDESEIRDLLLTKRVSLEELKMKGPLLRLFLLIRKTLKPKTIHNSLRKDKSFQNMQAELNKLV